MAGSRMRYISMVLVGWLALALVLAAPLSAPAAAHADMISADPDGESIVTEPLGKVTLVFATVAEPVGPGFQLVERNGIVREPTTISTEDGQTWVLGFDPPIIADSGLRWSLKSADSHLISGSLDLAVNVPAVASTTTTRRATTTTTTATTVPTPEVDVEPAITDTSGTSTQAVEDGELELSSAAGVAEDKAVAETADRPSLNSADMVAFLGRLATMVGVMVAIGVMVFLVHLLRGTTGEARLLLKLLRRSALLVVVGVVAEAAAQIAAETGSWSQVVSAGRGDDVLSARFVAAVALRLLGAFGVATGSQFERIPLGRDDSDSILARLPAMGRLAATPRVGEITNHRPLAVATDELPSKTPMLFRWRVSSSGSGAVLGIVAFVVAYVVDGHTLYSKAPVLSALASATHVLAAGVWVGGVVVLLNLLYRRLRTHRRAEAVDLAVRYSVVAALSLVMVGLAGSALTIVSIDSISELWSTDWGRLVLAKLSLVTVAGLFGAVNHFLLVPWMAVDNGKRGTGRSLGRVISIEAALLAIVVVLSAQLVSTPL